MAQIQINQSNDIIDALRYSANKREQLIKEKEMDRINKYGPKSQTKQKRFMRYEVTECENGFMIRDLVEEGYQGYRVWVAPTVEELGSLIKQLAEGNADA